METLIRGLGQLESPRWRDRRLWVADWTAGLILAIDPAGNSEIVVEHRSLPLCFDFPPDGTLVLASGPQRALMQMSAHGTLTRYADLSALSPYGGNDMVIDGRGNTYVNNVNFEFAAGHPPGGNAPGFVALAVPNEEPRIVADDLAFPNGMSVTADNSTLIVAESYRHQLTAFDILDDGSLTNRRVWAKVGEHSPDGICLDREGAAWYTDVADRCCVRVARAATCWTGCSSTAARSPAFWATSTALLCSSRPRTGPESNGSWITRHGRAPSSRSLHRAPGPDGRVPLRSHDGTIPGAQWRWARDLLRQRSSLSIWAGNAAMGVALVTYLPESVLAISLSTADHPRIDTAASARGG